jgi:prepilin-type N-terminal cleavage/methylation domain-containing protein
MIKKNLKLKMQNSKKNGGFTMIELIVVITIIAVMTIVAMVNYGGVNRKSRDGRRMADLEKYRVALEISRQIGSTYPASLNSLVGMNLINEISTDPKTGSDYTYVSTGYTYTLSAVMEDTGSTNVPGAYQVTNP